MDVKSGVTAGIWVFALVAGANAQSVANHAVGPSTTHLAAVVLRTIDDPATGKRWLVVRDPTRPGGPARAVLAEREARCSETDCARKPPIVARERPVIQAGDAVTVEEHTPMLDMRLQAVALESSLKGACLRARLLLGGKVERVIAIAPGRAAFVSESEVNACKPSPTK